MTPTRGIFIYNRFLNVLQFLLIIRVFKVNMNGLSCSEECTIHSFVVYCFRSCIHYKYISNSYGCNPHRMVSDSSSISTTFFNYSISSQYPFRVYQQSPSNYAIDSSWKTFSLPLETMHISSKETYFSLNFKLSSVFVDDLTNECDKLNCFSTTRNW